MSRLESRASHSLALRIPDEICECLCIWCIHYIPWHRRCKSVWQCNCMIFHFLWSLLISVCLSLYHSLTRSVSIAFGVLWLHLLMLAVRLHLPNRTNTWCTANVCFVSDASTFATYYLKALMPFVVIVFCIDLCKWAGDLCASLEFLNEKKKKNLFVPFQIVLTWRRKSALFASFVMFGCQRFYRVFCCCRFAPSSFTPLFFDAYKSFSNCKKSRLKERQKKYTHTANSNEQGTTHIKISK